MRRWTPRTIKFRCARGKRGARRPLQGLGLPALAPTTYPPTPRCAPTPPPQHARPPPPTRPRPQAIPVSWGGLLKLKVLALDGNAVADVPAEVLQGCAALHTLTLHANPITPAVLQANPAFAAFEERRKGACARGAGVR